MYQARIIADSTAGGIRLTTIEVTFPRIILAEFNTHRMFSRNSASSRAIPIEKRVRAVEENPFVPEAFAKNQKGMQAGEELSEQDQERARAVWLEACADAVRQAKALAAVGVHKQWANRLIEPYSWHTVVVTATEWENYWNLRLSSLAQPEIREATRLMKAVYDVSEPRHLAPGAWHLPYIQPDELMRLPYQELAKISTARCARVSYLTQDGRQDIGADILLHDRLFEARHMSPFEHVAKVLDEMEWYETAGDADFCGNFRYPFLQYRKTIPNEDVAPAEAP